MERFMRGLASFLLTLVCCLLLFAIVTLLGGCTAKPATVKPEKPRVDCLQPLHVQVPDWPAGDAWLTEGKPYAVQLLGIIADARIAHSAEAGCIDKLKSAGLIR